MSALENAFLRPTKYLTFEQLANPGRKTGIWNVRSASSGAHLGTIRWYGAWRQYCFYPTEPTIFNTDCLVEIADRLATCNRWQRNIRVNKASAAAVSVTPTGQLPNE